MEISEQPLVGLVLGKDEVKELSSICHLYCIEVNPSLLNDKRPHYLWGLGDDANCGKARVLGLLGTEVMRRLPFILHGIEELREYLEAVITWKRRNGGPTNREFLALSDQHLDDKMHPDFSKTGKTVVTPIPKNKDKED